MSNSVLLDLTTTTFQELVDEALAAIPPRAPNWTDYNVSDPGIMLIELLAWNTEAQIYALGHVRQDERTAYSALVGVRARGPQPAHGLIWPGFAPGGPLPWGGGVLLPAQSPIHAPRGNLPDLFLARTLWLHGAPLTSVVAVKRDGTRLDYTPGNQRRNGSFPVFGPAPAKGDSLLLGLGAHPVPYPSPQGAQLIAVGFHIRNSATGLTARTVASARFHATLRTGTHEHTLRVREDSTLGLAQTGVMLIECPADVLASGAAAILVLRFEAGELYPTPLAERIDLNVLPAVQQQQQQDPPTALGAPWPDQQVPLAQPGVCFDGEHPPVSVSLSTETGPPVAWRQVDDFSAAGPADPVFTFDPVAAVLQFGNGINGMIPATGSRLTASYRTSQGSIGNIAGGLEWEVPALNLPGVYGVNLDALTGGVDAEQLADLQARARSVCALQPIVTNADLLAVASRLTGLRLVRAEMAPVGTSPPSVRTLVALRERDPDDATNSTPETPAWLEAVRRALSTQLTLGQRLRVIAPSYVQIGLQAAATVSSDAEPSAIAGQIVLALQARLALFASAAAATPWPLGAAVAVQSIRGWIRAVPGVLSVTGLQLTSGGTTLTSGEISLPPTGLPQLSIAASDVSVTRTATGSRR
jgi:hypothetical protein